MLQRNPNVDIAVIFRQGMKIQVPPFEVPTERHHEGETYERTALNLAEAVGITASVSYALTVQPLDRRVDSPTRLYLLNDRTSGVTTLPSDFMVPAIELPRAIAEHERLSDTDRALFHAVIRHLEYSSL